MTATRAADVVAVACGLACMPALAGLGPACAKPASAGRSTPFATASTPPTRIVEADPANYLALLSTHKPGDTQRLAPGVYDNLDAPPGLPIFDLHGTAEAPITITGPEGGPRPQFRGRATHNTIRIADAKSVVVRNLDIDGRNPGGDGVNEG